MSTKNDDPLDRIAWHTARWRQKATVPEVQELIRELILQQEAREREVLHRFRGECCA